MIKLDFSFKETFFKHYGDVPSVIVLDKIADYVKDYDQPRFIGAMNIVKTGYTVGDSYSENYDRIAQQFGTGIEDPDELDKFIFSVIFYVCMFNAGSSALGEFLGVRFKARNIYDELARAIYGTSTKEDIEKVKAIRTEHTYSIQLPNPKTRDEWFYNMSLTVGSYSKCYSRKIGAVMVRGKSIVSTGYDGPPRGIPTCDQRWFIDAQFKTKYGHHLTSDDPKRTPEDPKGVCPRRIIGFSSGQGLEVCPSGHAERNALINAAKLGVSTKGTTLYVSCEVPCTPCMAEIINAEVDEIVCTSMHIYDETAMYLLENSDLKVRLFDFLL